MIKAPLFDHLPERLHETTEQAGETASLIGQRIGRVFWRELARQYPVQIRQVITIGRPFGAKNSAVAVPALTHLYTSPSVRSVDDARTSNRGPPDVSVTAIFSQLDDVVHWRACREIDEDQSTQSIEIIVSHCGAGFNPTIYYLLAVRLAQKSNRWSRFEWGCREHFIRHSIRWVKP